jgi:hypothetical protein
LKKEGCPRKRFLKPILGHRDFSENAEKANAIKQLSEALQTQGAKYTVRVG